MCNSTSTVGHLGLWPLNIALGERGREEHLTIRPESEPRIQVPSPNAPNIPLQPHIPVHPQINLLSNHHQTFPFLSLACTIPSSLTNCYPYSKISLKTTTFQKTKQNTTFQRRLFLSTLTWSCQFLPPLNSYTPTHAGPVEGMGTCLTHLRIPELGPACGTGIYTMVVY